MKTEMLIEIGLESDSKLARKLARRLRIAAQALEDISANKPNKMFHEWERGNGSPNILRAFAKQTLKQIRSGDERINKEDY